MARFTTREDAKDDIVTAIEAGDASATEYDIDAISYEVYEWKIDHDTDGNELLNTGGFEQVVDDEQFWQIVAKHEKQS